MCVHVCAFVCSFRVFLISHYTHTLSKKISLFVRVHEALTMSSCIIVPLITLTCNRVTTQLEQTRPWSRILLFPLPLLLYLSYLSWHLFTLIALSPFFWLCQGRLCPYLAFQPLTRFQISMCMESREAVWQLHCLLGALPLYLSLSLSHHLFTGMLPWHLLNFLNVEKTELLVFSFFKLPFFSCLHRIIVWENNNYPVDNVFLSLWVFVEHVCMLQHCSWPKQSP